MLLSGSRYFRGAVTIGILQYLARSGLPAASRSDQSFINQACSVKIHILLLKREGRTGRI